MKALRTQWIQTLRRVGPTFLPFADAASPAPRGTLVISVE